MHNANVALARAPSGLARSSPAERRSPMAGNVTPQRAASLVASRYYSIFSFI
jgi:hypothetical protein